jgi:hypothetical protein
MSFQSPYSQYRDGSSSTRKRGFEMNEQNDLASLPINDSHVCCQAKRVKYYDQSIIEIEENVIQQSSTCDLQDIDVEMAVEEDHYRLPTVEPRSSPNSAFFLRHSGLSSDNLAVPSVQCHSPRTVSNCWHCKKFGSLIPCRSCERTVCERSCVRCCDRCQKMCCSACTMIDYSFRYERTLCIDCYYHRD